MRARPATRTALNRSTRRSRALIRPSRSRRRNPTTNRTKPMGNNQKINDAVNFAVESMHLDRCQAHHFGPWMIEPEWFKNAVDAVNRGVWKAEGPTTEPADNQSPPYRVVNGTAVIPISGPMMK